MDAGMIAAGAGHGPESWRHDHDKHSHQYGGDPCDTTETLPGPHFTSGPHATDTANRLDPHVSSGPGLLSSTAIGSTGPGRHHGQGHHKGEEAALLGGAGAAGTGTHEYRHDSNTASGSEGSIHGSSSTGNYGREPASARGTGAVDNGQRDVQNIESSSTGPAASTAGPHKSDMLNKLDPRVDSDLSKQRGSTDTTGTGLRDSTDPYSSTPSGGHSHHHGRDAGLAAGVGGAAYEAEKHRRGNNATATSSIVGSSHPSSGSGIDSRIHSSSSDIPVSGVGAAGTGRDHHHARDGTDLGATIGAGGVASGVGRRHDQTTHSSAVPSTTSGSTYGGNHISIPRDNNQSVTGHHYGRDATLAGVGGLGAYEGEKHLHSHDQASTAATPQDRLAGSGRSVNQTDSIQQPHHKSGHHFTTGVLGGSGTTGTAGDYDRQPGGTRDLHPLVGTETVSEPSHDARHEHHVGRDIAASSGIAGVAYEGDKSRDHSRTNPNSNVHESSHPGSYSRDQSSLIGNDHKLGRDAAIAGGAGGVAGHEYSKKEAEKLQKEHAKEEKALEKEHSKEAKHSEKALAREAKEEQKHEKHDEKKHGGGLLGFLHRDKPDKQLKEEEAARKHTEDSLSSQRPGDEEMSSGAGAGTRSYGPGSGLEHEYDSQTGVHDSPIGAGTKTHDAYGTQEGHNKLHKDPPAKVLESRGYGGYGQ